MSGRKVISAYTPSNTDRGILKRIFVQREKLLERIVDRLSRSMTTGDKHQMLLVGPRGCGKTHLVSLAVWELQSKEALRDQMRIAWLGEDDSFTGLVHLAFGIARQLALEYPDEFPADFRTSVRGLSQDDAALVVLQSTIRRLGKRNLLLVTENMDQTFESLGDSGRKKWRAFLQETRKIATLATAQQLFAAVSDRKEAFFGFFDIQHLEPLSVDDAAELMAGISREQAKPDLASYLNSAEGRFRVRALHHLAGGNHRMYVLLAEFLTKDSLEDLVAAFESLANDMTPYFQERVRSLPDQQRQLVQCLCDADGAMTVKEIAGETFIDERSCSKQLGNLKAKGYVRSEKRGKESWYDMAEPLMRLCLEIKNQRGRPLRLVAKFLRAWFPPAALLGVVDAKLDSCSLDDFRTALTHAFVAGESKAAGYGGKPEDLLWMVLRRSPFEWAALVSEIAALFIRHGIAETLGSGVTRSIQCLDEGGFSQSQIDTWNTAWQQAGNSCEDLVIPLRCLAAGVEVMKSPTRSDRALFRLPLEIRELVRPLLQRSLVAGTTPTKSRVDQPAIITAPMAGPVILTR
jgi:DNA polymerase III delta prime subunit